MKWIGALLFLATTTWTGFEWSNQLHKRPVQIRQFKHALQILEAEMLYSQLPLQEAFKNISKQIPEPIQSFFMGLSNLMSGRNIDFLQVWDNQVMKLLKVSCFNNTDREIIKQFGRTLGQHNYEQQQKHIQLTIKHLDHEMQQARDQQARFGKMAKSLGFLCGLFIVLLLI